MLQLTTLYIKKNQLITSILLIGAVAILLRAYGLNIWLPPCIISNLTGYECFGCGLTTAALHLVRGEFNAAITTNPLIFVYLAGLAGWIGLSFYKFTLTQKQQLI